MLERTYPQYWLVVFTVILTIPCQGSDLTFVIDDSKSMAESIMQVRTAVETIMGIVLEEKSKQIDNFLLVTFNDTVASLRETSRDPKILMGVLPRNPVNYDHNYECPEMVLSGIRIAIEASRPGSYIFVFTDASAKDYREIVEIQDLCRQKQSQIVLVLTGDCHRPYSNRFQVYYDIADASSGLAFRLDGTEIKTVSAPIRETVKQNKILLTSRVTPSGKSTEVPFRIQKHLEYAVVLVTGLDVDLQIDPPVQMEKIMWTRHGKVIKLKHPGKYVATVKSTNATSVLITGYRNFDFHYGFSDQDPESFNDTKRHPFSDSRTKLVVSMTDPKSSVQVQSAQITDIKGRLVAELPLNELSPNLYTSELFVGSSAFKVAVKGKIWDSGEPFKITAEVPAYPVEKPPVPVRIITNESIEYTALEGDIALRIPCDAVGHPKPTIEWSVEGRPVTQGTKYDTEDGALIIRKPELNDSKSYTCTAKNYHSSDIKTFKGVVCDDPMDCGTSHKLFKLHGQPLNLTCNLPGSDTHVKWYKESVDWHVDKPYIYVEQASTMNDGNYTCHVSGAHGSATETYEVDVGHPPSFKFPQDDTLVDWNGDPDDVLDCIVDAKPQPMITWTCDGIVMKVNTFELRISKPGHCACEVSNVHGVLEREFNVVRAGTQE